MNNPPRAAEFGQPFVLQRDHDISGVSGTGIVADGIVWPDGTVSVRWRGPHPSTVAWDRLEDAMAVHGHAGATRIIWADPEDTRPDTPLPLSGSCPTCTDVLPGDDEPDSLRTPPDPIRRQYADAIRAAQWAPPDHRTEAITDAVLAVRDRAMEVLTAALAQRRSLVLAFGLENRDLRERLSRIRAYAGQLADNTVQAQVLSLLEAPQTAGHERPALPRRQDS
ncbi:hypothetical protein [Streptomyces sp. NPDC053048]|uniref:hypothetical protein n=1 Tax=Streptomyces sp. NPDC053048 TaxID=3365694 RepID=UPI0037D3953F